MCWETLIHLLAHMLYVISVVGEEREGKDTQVLNCHNLGVTYQFYSLVRTNHLALM